jgi:hypothetical protein
MKNKDQILLEETYGKINQAKEQKKVQMKAYDELSETFASRLKEMFGNSLFSKKKIYDNQEKFSDLDEMYKQIFNTDYSLFDFQATGERLGNLLSKVGIKHDDLKMEEGPNGMIYWFENESVQ